MFYGCSSDFEDDEFEQDLIQRISEDKEVFKYLSSLKDISGLDNFGVQIEQGKQLINEASQSASLISKKYFENSNNQQMVWDAFESATRTIALQIDLDDNLLIFRQYFESKHEINATIQEVWDVLVDIENYSAWNSFVPSVETTFEIGSPIIMQVNLIPNLPALTQKETIYKFDPLDKMCWVTGSPVLFRTERCMIVEEMNNSDKTLFVNNMQYTGLLAPLINVFTKKLVFEGFNKSAVGLIDYMEES